MVCMLCPRRCGADRSKARGFCGSNSSLSVARASLHMWEEPCISGVKGSGTVFLSGCNLRCVFCQNYPISQQRFGREVSIEQLRKIILALKVRGAHNINLVNPTHYSLLLRDCLGGIPELGLPVIYNTNGYDSPENLEVSAEFTDVYLPDLKYMSAELSEKYSGASDYFQVASKAILEMYKQAGPSVLGPDGMIRSGLVVRHLVLPGCTSDTINILKWIRDNLPPDVYVSLMSQYTPVHRADMFPEINRRLTRREYEKVLNCFYRLGFENGYVQERESAVEEYIPDFNLEGVDQITDDI